MHLAKRYVWLLPVVTLLIEVSGAGCRQPSELSSKTKKKMDSVPAWAKNAIWYQIFVERFRNGDPGNDPTPPDMAGSFPERIPHSWKITTVGTRLVSSRGMAR